MAGQLATGRAVKPRRAAVRRLAVHATSRPSPGFARVTLASTHDGFEDDFDYLGYDQWCRLFLPPARGNLVLPEGDAEGWSSRWLALGETRRPAVRNYTIRDARHADGRWLIDIDFVVHRSAAGTVEGLAARWALAAAPGDRVGLLDQGRIFGSPASGAPVTVVADESGLPGVEGIARSLAGQPARYLLEVPDAADIRDLPTDLPRGATWIVRQPGQAAGSGVLAALTAGRLDAASYVYAVGEASLVLRARHLARAAGVADERIDFCAYWRSGRRAALPGGR